MHTGGFIALVWAVICVICFTANNISFGYAGQEKNQAQSLSSSSCIWNVLGVFNMKRGFHLKLTELNCTIASLL